MRDQPARKARGTLARVRPLIGLAAALGVLALAGQVTSGSLRTTPTTTPERRDTPVTTLPPSPVAARIRLGADPQQVVFGDGAVWVADGPVVRRIDPTANRVVATVPLGGRALAMNLAADADAVWVAVGDPGEVVRIDPVSNQVVARVPVARRLLAPVGLAIAGDSVWVSCCALEPPGLVGELIRIDAAANRVAARLPLPQGPLALVADASALWTTTIAGQVLQIDLLTGQVARSLGPFGDGSRLQSVAASPRELWLGDPGQGVVLAVDKQSGRLASRLVTGPTTQLAVDETDVWLVSSNDRGLSRMAQRDARVTGAVPLVQLRDLKTVAVGAGAVWVTTGSALVRVDPFRVAPLAS